MLFSNIAGVPLGVARAAIAEAKEVASTKVVMPSLTYARGDPTVQDAIGRAESLVAASRACLFDVLGRIWDTLRSGRPLSPAEWSAFRLANTYVFRSCKDAVGLVCEILGTTGVYRRSPLDCHLRDVTTMAQHLLCQTKTYAACGRSLLGLEPVLVGF